LFFAHAIHIIFTPNLKKYMQAVEHAHLPFINIILMHSSIKKIAAGAALAALIAAPSQFAFAQFTATSTNNSGSSVNSTSSSPTTQGQSTPSNGTTNGTTNGSTNGTSGNGTTGGTGTGGTGSGTGSTGTGGATTNTTPGAPNTGAGGDMTTNLLLLAATGLIGAAGLVYLGHRRASRLSR
jgi:hypothetical protein